MSQNQLLQQQQQKENFVLDENKQDEYANSENLDNQNYNNENTVLYTNNNNYNEITKSDSPSSCTISKCIGGCCILFTFVMFVLMISGPLICPVEQHNVTYKKNGKEVTREEFLSLKYVMWTKERKLLNLVSCIKIVVIWRANKL